MSINNLRLVTFNATNHFKSIYILLKSSLVSNYTLDSVTKVILIMLRLHMQHFQHYFLFEFARLVNGADNMYETCKRTFLLTLKKGFKMVLSALRRLYSVLVIQICLSCASLKIQLFVEMPF